MQTCKLLAIKLRASVLQAQALDINAASSLALTGFSGSKRKKAKQGSKEDVANELNQVSTPTPAIAGAQTEDRKSVV